MNQNLAEYLLAKSEFDNFDGQECKSHIDYISCYSKIACIFSAYKSQTENDIDFWYGIYDILEEKSIEIFGVDLSFIEMSQDFIVLSRFYPPKDAVKIIMQISEFWLTDSLAQEELMFICKVHNLKEEIILINGIIDQAKHHEEEIIEINNLLPIDDAIEAKLATQNNKDLN